MTEMRVPDDEWNSFMKDRQGAIAGASLAKRFGWKVGDRIPIINALYGPTKTWDFVLDGIIKTIIRAETRASSGYSGNISTRRCRR